MFAAQSAAQGLGPAGFLIPGFRGPGMMHWRQAITPGVNTAAVNVTHQQRAAAVIECNTLRYRYTKVSRVNTILHYLWSNTHKHSSVIFTF